MDLLALAEAGYPVSLMIKNALISYAKGTPLFYYIDEDIPVNSRDTKVMRVTFMIGKKEVETIELLNSIIASKKSTFCKALLRNALVQQNLNCYFANKKMESLHLANRKSFNVEGLENVIALSMVRADRSFSFLGKTFERNVLSNDSNTVGEKVKTNELNYSEYKEAKKQPPVVAKEPKIAAPVVKNEPIANEEILDNYTDEVSVDNISDDDNESPPVMSFDNKLFSVFESL